MMYRVVYLGRLPVSVSARRFYRRSRTSSERGSVRNKVPKGWYLLVYRGAKGHSVLDPVLSVGSGEEE